MGLRISVTIVIIKGGCGVSRVLERKQKSNFGRGGFCFPLFMVTDTYDNTKSLKMK